MCLATLSKVFCKFRFFFFFFCCLIFRLNANNLMVVFNSHVYFASIHWFFFIRHTQYFTCRSVNVPSSAWNEDDEDQNEYTKKIKRKTISNYQTDRIYILYYNVQLVEIYRLSWTAHRLTIFYVKIAFVSINKIFYRHSSSSLSTFSSSAFQWIFDVVIHSTGEFQLRSKLTWFCFLDKFRT